MEPQAPCGQVPTSLSAQVIRHRDACRKVCHPLWAQVFRCHRVSSKVLQKLPPHWKGLLRVSLCSTANGRHPQWPRPKVGRLLSAWVFLPPWLSWKVCPPLGDQVLRYQPTSWNLIRYLSARVFHVRWEVFKVHGRQVAGLRANPSL